MPENKKYYEWVNILPTASDAEISAGVVPIDIGTASKKYTPVTQTDLADKVDKATGYSLLQDTTKTSYDDHLANTTTAHDFLSTIRNGVNVAGDDLNKLYTLVTALNSAMRFIDGWDASSGVFPGGGTAENGYVYEVTVAGTVDSVSFDIKDRIVAIADNASTTTFASNWFKEDYTDQVTLINAVTLTNKRITSRVNSSASNATPTLNTDLYDAYEFTAQTTDILLAVSGTPTNRQSLEIYIKGTAARAIAYTGDFAATTIALPTTTTGTAELKLFCLFSSASGKWEITGVV